MAQQQAGTVKQLGQLVDVFRSAKEAELYLYLPRHDNALEEVPEELLAKLGKLTLALSLNLTPTKKLARADSQKVLSELKEKGYYLQLPPSSFTSPPHLNTKKTS